jgi:uncharacterized membrane protein YfcA
MTSLTGSIALLGIAMFAACLSAVVSFGGGTLLLPIMFLILDFALVIPVFGVIQISSAISRAWFFRQFIDWSIFPIFIVGFIPAAVLGSFIWSYTVFNEEFQPYMMILIAVYLFLFLKFPKFNAPKGSRTKLLLSMGAAAGLATLTIGVIGVIIAPFIDSLGLKKERAVAAIGALAFFTNLIKLPLLFIISEQLNGSIVMVMAGMVGATILGTYFGRHFHGRVSEVLFIKIFRTVLFMMAVKLFIWDGWRVIFA